MGEIENELVIFSLKKGWEMIWHRTNEKDIVLQRLGASGIALHYCPAV
jgi:hypothetical protein